MVGLFFAFSQVSSADAALNIQQLRIQAQRAGWKSGKNSVTRLSRQDFKKRLGLQDAPDGMASFQAIPMRKKGFRAQALPPKIDWRNKDGANWVSPMLNQGNCGSCVAFAAVATLETQTNITSGNAGYNPEYSTQALFACGGGSCDNGWQPQLAAKHLMNKGVPDEGCAPYTMGYTGETVSCSSICSDSGSRSSRISSYSTPSFGFTDIQSVKSALQKGPLVTTMMVYEDFATYNGGIYKHVSGTTLGGHAISLVGYDDATQSWLIRNSWGKDWGEEGFARVSWDDVSGIGDRTWGYAVPSIVGYVAVRNPQGRDYVAGNISITAETNLKELHGVELQVIDEKGKVLDSHRCDTMRCSWGWNSKSIPDGEYQVKALASWGGGQTMSSQVEHFYVANTPPKKGSITFSGAEGVNLARPLKGRVVFDIDIDSGSDVPLSSISYEVKQGEKIVYSKHSDGTLPKMTMGWRTINVPNGKYTLQFKGELKVNGKVTTKVVSKSIDVTVENKGDED